MIVRVGLCQFRAKTGDADKNLEIIRDLSGKAARMDADITVFPELALSGYMARDEIFALAEPVTGHYVEELTRIAEEYGLYLVVGMPELDEETLMLYNSAVLVGPQGLVGVYRKRHLPSYGLFDEARYFKPFRGPIEVFDLPFGKVGLAVCYDLFFPEVVRAEVLRGAKLIITISAAPDMSREHFETLVKARAMENTVFVTYVNLVGFYEGIGFFGGSHIRGPLGELITKLGIHEEGVTVGEIDLAYLRSAREIRPFLGDVNMSDFSELYETAVRGVITKPPSRHSQA